MEQYRPFLIRASALMDAAEQAQNVDMEQQAQMGNAGPTIMEQMAKILNPGTLVQASYGNRMTGQKRSNEAMASAPAAAAASSSGMWKNDQTQYAHPAMAALFAKAAENDDGMIRRQDVMSSTFKGGR